MNSHRKKFTVILSTGTPVTHIALTNIKEDNDSAF